MQEPDTASSHLAAPQSSRTSVEAAASSKAVTGAVVSWKAVEIGNGGSYDNPVPVYEIHTSDGRRVIAEYAFKRDAFLLAAAPDLLAVLRDTLDWLDDGNRLLSDACAADVAKARAVIAKATGGAA